MKPQEITDTINSLKSFLEEISKKLNKKQRNELENIILRLEANQQHPNKEEIMELAILFFKVMMQGAELIHHHHR